MKRIIELSTKEIDYVSGAFSADDLGYFLGECVGAVFGVYGVLWALDRDTMFTHYNYSKTAKIIYSAAILFVSSSIGAALGKFGARIIKEASEKG